MSDHAPSTAQVRAYLDQAVVDAADRWVGRSLDATAYADLVAAVLARREAMGSAELTRPMETATLRPVPVPVHVPVHVPVPVQVPVDVPVAHAEPPEPDPRDRLELLVPANDHTPAWRAPQFGVVMPDHSTVRVETIGAVAYGPTSYDLVHATHTDELPVRPPGRHRSPPAPVEPAPVPIDLSEDLSTVLSWLGRPES